MRLVAGLCPDPLGSLQRFPRSPSWVKGESKGLAVEKGKGQGRPEEPSQRKMRHRNPQRDKNKEVGGTKFNLVS